MYTASRRDFPADPQHSGEIMSNHSHLKVDCSSDDEAVWPPTSSSPRCIPRFPFTLSIDLLRMKYYFLVVLVVGSIIMTMMCYDQRTCQLLSQRFLFGLHPGVILSRERRDTAGMEPQSLTSIGRGILISSGLLIAQLTGSAIWRTDCIRVSCT